MIVSDLVLEARALITSISPTTEKWDAEVVPSVRRLAEKTMPELSRGFGDGLVAVGIAMWFYAASAFCKFLESEDFAKLGRTFFLFCFPLLVAHDVAGASSDCDSISQSLNDIRGATMDMKTDQKLQLLERFLALSNRGQG